MRDTWLRKAARRIGGALLRVGGAARLRRSIENPSISLQDRDAWNEIFYGEDDIDAGVKVSAKSALTYAAVWRAVFMISGDVARLPLSVYRRLTPRGKERERDHAAARALRAPNPYMPPLVLWQTLMGHVLLRGNGYAYIFRDGAGNPAELLPLNPDETFPVRKNGELLYVTSLRKRQEPIPATDVLHVRGLGFDGLVGYSVIEFARQSLGLGLAAREYGARFFGNNARPNVVLAHPGKLSDDAARRLSESWEAAYGGLRNAHRTAILEEGMKAEALTISAKDSQLLEMRDFEIREIANWFGVPPHKLGHGGRTAYASLEQENQAYLDQALDYWLTSVEQECCAKLLSPAEREADTHTIEFVRQALVRADLQTRTASYATAVQNGWMTLNEIRERENLNPIEGGDVFYRPLNVQAVGGAESLRGGAESAEEDNA